ncbi:MAG: hypothetical protein SFU98_19830 [Leptospiraceae bacterium]|nr:hypothetical protein [Leptospiraceae bacterium]
MKKWMMLAIFSAIVVSEIQAERILGTPGVISEFGKVEELTKNRKVTLAYRKKTLDKNLTDAVKFTIMKKYPDYAERTKELNAGSISFEQQKGTFNYFIKYKEYYFYYSFAVDPELYVQFPVDDRVYIKSKEIEEDEKTSGAPPSSQPNKPLMDGQKN